MIFRLFAYCLTALMTLCLIWLVGWLWFAASVVSAKPEDENIRTDAIIVLTGGDKRVNTGLDLLAADKADHLFISGVNAQVKPVELVALWKGDHDKVLPKIKLGYIADSTAGNAIESKDWIREKKIKSIRLVTANYHMARSMMMFKNAVPDVVIYEHPVVPNDFEPWGEQFWPLTFSEYNKLLATWLRLDLLTKNPSLDKDKS
jgi:uncharacterized SAM-binding protein YcdF (DUF218 family)